MSISFSTFFHTLSAQVFGEVWLAPTLTISAEDIRGSVEKEIATKEEELKHKKKQPKGKAAAKAEPKPDKAGLQIIEDDDVWSIPSADELEVKPAKSSKTSSGADSASAARKRQRQREASWRKEVQKATKVIASLTSVSLSLVNTSRAERVAKATDLVFTQEVKDSLKTATEKLSKLKDRALHDLIFWSKCLVYVFLYMIFCSLTNWHVQQEPLP